MSLIPDDELQRPAVMNLAPMVDFLFLVLAVFATMAIARTALFDTEVDLVKLKPEKEEASNSAYNQNYIVNIGVTENGQYKWITEVNEFLIADAEGIKRELYKQQQLGLLPYEKNQIKILLHIDKNAKWDPIVQALFSVRDAGFQINPVYEPVD